MYLLKWNGNKYGRSDQEQKEYEFMIANKFFKINPKALKMPRDIDISCLHSFLKVGDEIFAIGSQWCSDAILGKGGFGVVKVAEDRDGNDWAVKMEKLSKHNTENVENRAELEIMALLGELKEGNHLITRTLEKPVMDFIKKRHLFMKLKPGRELFKDLIGNKYTELDKIEIAIGICKAVRVIHSKGIVHADLKPSNIMISIGKTNKVLSIIDFNLSVKLEHEAFFVVDKSLLGTQGYFAPETMNEPRRYSFASDVYALGKIFTEDLKLNEKLCVSMLDETPEKRPELDVIIKNLEQELKNNVSKNILNLENNVGNNTHLVLISPVNFSQNQLKHSLFGSQGLKFDETDNENLHQQMSIKSIDDISDNGSIDLPGLNMFYNKTDSECKKDQDRWDVKKESKKRKKDLY